MALPRVPDSVAAKRMRIPWPCRAVISWANRTGENLAALPRARDFGSWRGETTAAMLKVFDADANQRDMIATSAPATFPWTIKCGLRAFPAHRPCGRG
eukprot:276823-Pyramimonas_sp.AAC.1